MQARYLNVLLVKGISISRTSEAFSKARLAHLSTIIGIGVLYYVLEAPTAKCIESLRPDLHPRS